MRRWQVLSTEGLLFGRWNIIDAAALSFVCLLIPLAYGAYLLFRPAPARVIAVEPATVPAGTMQVNVRGEGLRPYLRIKVGEMGATFLFANSNGGVLQLPALPPGSHDVVLLDVDTEIGRIAGGLVVEQIQAPRLPEAVLLAVGAFTGLDARGVDALASGLRTAERKPAAWGELLGFQQPERNGERLEASSVTVLDGRYRIRAVLRLPCVLMARECRVKEVALKPGAVIPVPVGGDGAAFQIDEIHAPATSVVDVVMRVYLSPEELALLQRGDRTDGGFPAWDALRPRFVTVTSVGRTDDGQQVANVRMRVPVVSAPERLTTDGRPLRIGENITFERGVQRVSGRIVAIGPEASR